MVERSAVNRFVVGSNPTWGVFFEKPAILIGNSVDAIQPVKLKSLLVI